MGVAYTNYQRSVGMDEASARAIQAKTHLFGYKPDAYPYRGQWHLSVCSDSDAETVKSELAALQSLALN